LSRSIGKEEQRFVPHVRRKPLKVSFHPHRERNGREKSEIRSPIGIVHEFFLFPQVGPLLGRKLGKDILQGQRGYSRGKGGSQDEGQKNYG